MGGYLDVLDEDMKICDDQGTFFCKCGDTDRDVCPRNRFINPYAGSEEFAQFGLFDFDHLIERHQIIDKFADVCLRKPPNKDVNIEHFFNLMFTRDNLRFVHRECHPKKRRNVKWQESKFYKDKPVKKDKIVI